MKRILVAISCVSIISLNAAILRVENQSNSKVDAQVEWNNAWHTKTIEAGKTGIFNSGLRKITGVKWGNIHRKLDIPALDIGTKIVIPKVPSSILPPKQVIPNAPKSTQAIEKKVAEPININKEDLNESNIWSKKFETTAEKSGKEDRETDALKDAITDEEWERELEEMMQSGERYLRESTPRY